MGYACTKIFFQPGVDFVEAIHLSSESLHFFFGILGLVPSHFLSVLCVFEVFDESVVF